jgi:regulator of protease activity HflC (stomatin/prohibitin superfamily)
MSILCGALTGVVGWFLLVTLGFSWFTVNQNERAVKTVFGRAQRIAGPRPPPPDAGMTEEEAERYRWPQLKVIPPGGPYLRMPWEQVHKVSVATQTLNMAYDPEDPNANRGGAQLDAVTKDQLVTGLTGQIRYRVSEQMLYPYLFGVKKPIAHVMGFFISILRERIANFEAPAPPPSDGTTIEPTIAAAGVSINDLRKNLRDLNEHMDQESRSSSWRYGIVLDASLITGIDPPHEVESALAAINTAHNQVSSDISLAQASADQKMVQSRRAVEIETLNAQAEVEPLLALAKELADLKANGGSPALQAYLRNVRLSLLGKAATVILETKR